MSIPPYSEDELPDDEYPVWSITDGQQMCVPIDLSTNTPMFVYFTDEDIAIRFIESVPKQGVKPFTIKNVDERIEAARQAFFFGAKSVARDFYFFHIEKGCSGKLYEINQFIETIRARARN